MERHEYENEIVRTDGVYYIIVRLRLFLTLRFLIFKALGHGLVLLHCEVPSLPHLLQVKPVLVTYEAIEAHSRLSTPLYPLDELTQTLQRAVNEDWARLYHMSAITANHFMGHDNFIRAHA
jgi:hypothetical protein